MVDSGAAVLPRKIARHVSLDNSSLRVESLLESLQEGGNGLFQATNGVNYFNG